MCSQKEYYDLLIQCRLDHSKFVDMQQSLSGKGIVEKLADDFEIVFTFKATCAHFTDYSYRDHVELCVLSRETSTLELPYVDQWKSLDKYGKSKDILQA